MPNVLMAGLPDEVALWLEHRLNAVSFHATHDREDTLGALSRCDWSLLIIDRRLAGPALEERLRRLRFRSGSANPGEVGARADGPPIIYVMDKTAGSDMSAQMDQPPDATLLLTRSPALTGFKVLFHPLDGEDVARQVADALSMPLLPVTDQRTGQNHPDGTRPAAAELWEKVKETNMSRLDLLERATVALLEGTVDRDLWAQAVKETQKLASSLDTFGFTKGAHVAREMKQLLGSSDQSLQLGGQNPGASPWAAEKNEIPQGYPESTRFEVKVVHLSELVLNLRRELESSAAHTAVAPSAGDEGSANAKNPAAETGRASNGEAPFLLVVSSDEDLAERLLMQALARGMRARAATSPRAARALVTRMRPDAVLLDLSNDTANDGLVLLSELGGRTPPVPVLVLADRDTFVDRIQVASLGCHAFLQKWLPAPEVLDAVKQVLQQSRVAEGRVLVVDDDPHVLASIRVLLEPHGLTLTTLNDPLRFWDVLEATAPDVVLIDMNMRYVSGTELCRVVRNDARWSSTPVLFLTEDRDLDTVHQVFAAGADDFISKSPAIVEPELVSRIVSRVQRTQLFRTIAETDTLTGLVNRRKAMQTMGHFLHRAGSRGHVCLAVLHLDNFKEINDKYGQIAGDAVLRRLSELLLGAFRGEDLVARLGGAAFLIGLNGMTRTAGAQRVAEILEALRQEAFFGASDAVFRVTFSAGVAQFPEDGTDLQALQRSVDEALLQAKAAGGDRVVAAGWRPDASEDQAVRSADVVVVDEDDALASLLLHALETRGYRTHRLTDGEIAAMALGGANPQLTARVILLSVNLPGLDGFGVLRRLAGDGVVQRTRVIMLTHRTAETEVMRALEMGAFDHVSKPFSLPVLMHRIGRAMEA